MCTVYHELASLSVSLLSILSCKSLYSLLLSFLSFLLKKFVYDFCRKHGNGLCDIGRLIKLVPLLKNRLNRLPRIWTSFLQLHFYSGMTFLPPNDIENNFLDALLLAKNYLPIVTGVDFSLKWLIELGKWTKNPLESPQNSKACEEKLRVLWKERNLENANDLNCREYAAKQDLSNNKRIHLLWVIWDSKATSMTRRKQ